MPQQSQEDSRKPDHGEVVVFGEVLFDQFPDGSSVLGGAPFNVAWHLAALGARPLLVSRIGEDDAGRSVIAAMEARGMETRGVQRDAERPTGGVRVSISGGEPRYEILADRAYDHIDGAAATATLAGARPRLTYHGTLALRAPESARALDALLAGGADAFMDVNLRDPWWQRDRLPTLGLRARWVKLNEAEFCHIAAESGIAPARLCEESMRELGARLELDLLVVTRGSGGAWAVDAVGELTRVAPERGIEVIDTVGAGDALAAVVICGVLRGWPTADTLRRAQRLASRVCGIRGATTKDLSIYDGVVD